MMKFIDLETYRMGTNIIQRIYGKKHEVATQLVEEELRRLENMLSFYKPFSYVSLINRNAGYEYVHILKETLHIIKKSKEFSKLCDGTFDITVAPLIELWRFIKITAFSLLLSILEKMF